jgi:hypothetical protein
MHNKSDILECVGIVKAACIAATLFVAGWAFGAILIAEDCAPFNKSEPPTFEVLGETFTCSKVAP